MQANYLEIITDLGEFYRSDSIKVMIIIIQNRNCYATFLEEKRQQVVMVSSGEVVKGSVPSFLVELYMDSDVLKHRDSTRRTELRITTQENGSVSMARTLS